MTPAATLSEREAEPDQVVRWRLETLIDAGYSAQLAQRIAERVDVDLHLAVELLERGCRPAVAALILL